MNNIKYQSLESYKHRADKPYAKKSLGQHFLQSSSALTAMCDAGNVQVGDIVLEIGPGRGALTTELLARGARVITVEKDRSLMPELEMLFEKEIASGQLRLLEGDALELNAGEVVCKTTTSTLPLEKGEGNANSSTQCKFKIIANIPYYITGALFERFLSADVQPTALVFLVQKEVAERIARRKKESILSLSVKVYGVPKYIKTVPRGAFVPAPTVDSAILSITNVSREHFKNKEHEEMFFSLLHAGFAHKRKLLASNLKPILGEDVEALLIKSLIPPKARAEDVSLDKWIALSCAL